MKTCENCGCWFRFNGNLFNFGQCLNPLGTAQKIDLIFVIGTEHSDTCDQHCEIGTVPVSVRERLNEKQIEDFIKSRKSIE